MTRKTLIVTGVLVVLASGISGGVRVLQAEAGQNEKKLVAANRAAAHEVSESARATARTYVGRYVSTDYAKEYRDNDWQFTAELKSDDGAYRRLNADGFNDPLRVGNMLKGRTVSIKYVEQPDVTVGKRYDSSDDCSVDDTSECRVYSDAYDRFLKVSIQGD